MKIIKPLFITLFALLLTGCVNHSLIINSTKPIFYERLDTKNRGNVKFEFKAAANIDAKEIKDGRPPLRIDLKITNNCRQPIKFDLAHFQLVNQTNHPALTEVVTIKPKQTRKIIGLFDDVYQIPALEPLIVSYFAGKFELGKITKVTNQAELDQWIIEHQVRDGKVISNQNKPFTDAQLIAWIGNVLTKMHEGKLTRDDFLYRISNLGGIKIISVQENHAGPNMKARGADPNTRPVIYQLYLNEQNQLEDYQTHEIFSEKYPG